MKNLFVLCIAGFAASTGAQPDGLDSLLLAAQSNRPALRAATLRLEQARHDSRALGAYPATRLSLGYSSDPESGGSDDDLVISQPLDLFGRTRAWRRSGRANRGGRGRLPWCLDRNPE